MPPFMLRIYRGSMCENTTTGSWRPPPDLAAVGRFQLRLADPFNTRYRVPGVSTIFRINSGHWSLEQNSNEFLVLGMNGKNEALWEICDTNFSA